MENLISIEHDSITSFSKRRNYFLFSFIGIVSFFSLLTIFNNKYSSKDFFIFIGIFFLLFGFIITYEIIKTKLYLVDFFSDSNKVKILYYDGSKELVIESFIENIDVKLFNKSSRAGFKCDLKIYIEDIIFTINKDFDWNYNEIKLLFEYVKFHKKEPFSENEKFITSRIVEHLKKYPF